MTAIISEFDSTLPVPTVFTKGDHVLTNSRDVATYFEKNHRDVTRAIKNLECSQGFRQRNFAHTPYIEPQNGQTYKMYEMTKDGFVFLVMGFTGSMAAKFKEAYIERFNEMEAALREQASAQINSRIISLETKVEMLSQPKGQPDGYTGRLVSYLEHGAKISDAVTIGTTDALTCAAALRSLTKLNEIASMPVIAPPPEKPVSTLVRHLITRAGDYGIKRALLLRQVNSTAAAVDEALEPLLRSGRVITASWQNPKGGPRSTIYLAR